MKRSLTFYVNWNADFLTEKFEKAKTHGIRKYMQNIQSREYLLQYLSLIGGKRFCLNFISSVVHIKIQKCIKTRSINVTLCY